MSELPDACSQQCDNIAGLPKLVSSTIDQPLRTVNDDFACGGNEYHSTLGAELYGIKSNRAHQRSEIETSTSLLVCDGARQCTCASCLLLGATRSDKLERIKDWQSVDKKVLACKFSGCTEIAYLFCDSPSDDRLYRKDFAKHERTHFGKVGEYHCLEEGCNTTTKKFADLKRHHSNKHCTNAPKFSCPVLGCKYGGDNGFTREDKLKSHHRNVHQGKAAPGKAFQPLKPKTDGAKVVKGKSTSKV